MFDEFSPHRKWYQFGFESPMILWKRLNCRPIRSSRMAYQRVRYGLSDADAWSLDYHLAKVTVRGIGKLREWAHGYPMDTSPEEWDAILAEIQEGFQTWLDCDGWFATDSEREKFDAAMVLYGKWFNALWD